MAKRKYNRRRKSKPNGRAKNERHKVRDRYAHAREDAQLLGLLPTTPEQALRPERVDPSSQDEQRFPGLDRAAILGDGTGGWSVPEPVKRKVIEQNAEVLYERRTTWVRKTKDGPLEEVELPPDRQAIDKASRVLIQADQNQHDRDHPKDERGTSVEVNVNNRIDFRQLLGRQEAADPLERQIEDAERGDDQPAPSVNGDGGSAQAGGDAVAP